MSTVRLSRSGSDVFTARLDELVAVYKAAFLDVYEPRPDSAARDRRSTMLRHVDRPGFVLATADDDDAGLVGFCYTTHGGPGQWWHDVVARAMGEPESTQWLADAREVVELHVRPEAQGDGLGRRLLRLALDGAAERTAVLSALDLPDTRARHLYEAEGFRPLRTGFRFPGAATTYVVMGKQLVAAG